MVHKVAVLKHLLVGAILMHKMAVVQKHLPVTAVHLVHMAADLDRAGLKVCSEVVVTSGIESQHTEQAPFR